MNAEKWTGRAKAFDGLWYPVTVEACRRRAVIRSAAGVVSPNVAVELDCPADFEDAGEAMLRVLADNGYRNVTLSMTFPQHADAEEQP